jgi:ribonuclease P/MRP protein subunit RPP40
MSKAFDKVIARYIINRTAGIWHTNKQHGFLPGKCTMDAVIKVMFDIGKAIDSKLSVISIFFDFAKAFDLVPHDLLLAKLDSLTLPDSPEKLLPQWLINWIAAYLTDRQQRVRVNNIETAWTPVKAGVIQGSVLGPILFLLYIADITEYMPADVEFEKYADDIINNIIAESYFTSAHTSINEKINFTLAM